MSQMVYNIMFLDNSMPVNYKTTCSRQMVNGPRSVPFSWYEYTYMRMCLFINRINNKNLVPYASCSFSYGINVFCS